MSSEPLEPPSTPLPLPPEVRRRIAAFDAAADRAFDRLRGQPATDRLFYAASELGDFSLLWHLVNSARALRPGDHIEESVRLAAGLGLEAVLVNGLVKSVFGRRRPTYLGPHPHRLRRPLTSSFPSGHASAAFFAAGLLSERSRWSPAWHGLAAVVAASRIYVKIHHASDVAGGVMVGVVLARLARRAWPLDHRLE
ncbi:MAG: phosphatase PAP2 family protein [Acidimicrobiales bacterium]